jgi:hypothetical protein
MKQGVASPPCLWMNFCTVCTPACYVLKRISLEACVYWVTLHCHWIGKWNEFNSILMQLQFVVFSFYKVFLLRYIVVYMHIFYILPYTFPVFYNKCHNVTCLSCYIMVTSRYVCRVSCVRMTFIHNFVVGFE